MNLFSIVVLIPSKNKNNKEFKMKKLFLVAFLLLSSTILINAQNPDGNFQNLKLENLLAYSTADNPLFTSASWSSLPASPHAQSRSTCAYIKRNDTAYIYQFGGGSTAALLTNVARFNFATNTWTNNFSTMPQSISAGGTAVIGDSLIFVTGGYSTVAGSITGYMLKYNVITNTWTQKTNVPQGVTDALVFPYQDSLIYIIGGGDGLFGSTTMQRNTVQIYHILTDTYTSGGTLPIVLAMMGGGRYMDTVIVACGATSGGTYTANCYKGVINPTTFQITFTPIAAYPGANVTRMASYLVQIPGQGAGIACALGAVAGGTYYAGANLWNFCTGTWQTLPSNSLARSNLRGCGGGDSSYYVVSGWTGSGTGVTDRLKFTIIDGTCAVITGTGNNGNVLPADYILEQNYPNPFNPVTVINYYIPKAGQVQITVSDILGKEIAVLVNQNLPAGKFAVDFDASSLSSGVYFYTLTSGDFRETKKMLLIK
jgi:hypothetical protein